MKIRPLIRAEKSFHLSEKKNYQNSIYLLVRRDSFSSEISFVDIMHRINPVSIQARRVVD